jgi:hypothetical protein
VGEAGIPGRSATTNPGRSAYPHKETPLQEHAYESPEILETFNAQEVMGAAEGLFSQGSTCDSKVAF